MSEFIHASSMLGDSIKISRRSGDPAIAGDCGRQSVVGHDGRVFGADLVEKTDHRERVMEKLTALGEMTGGIAHDFRNLLTVIDAGLRLTEKNLQQPETARIYIAATREGIDRAVRLTAELLSFAKRQDLGSCTSDLNELLGKLELFLGYSAGPKIRVELNLAADEPKCAVDRSQFDAAILNLVVNARDAMPNGGEIKISTDRWANGPEIASSQPPRQYIRVRVADNGAGMPPEVLAKIFDLFFTTKGEKGTGLGLPHIGAYMRLIGGYIVINSEVGAGTVVDLFFPATDMMPVQKAS